jgi:sarcosine oxidase
MNFDVVVIGLGAIGSATLHQLARRGERVLGLDRFEPGHERGSSHGHTRIIRLGYYEHPSYVPLLHETYRLWAELEAETGRPLMRTTGIVEIGAPDSELIRGTLATSREHRLRHELLDAAEVMRRYPAYTLPAHFVGVVQPDAAVLEAEPSVQAMQTLAVKHGAQIRSGERVLSVAPKGDGVRIVTERDTIDAGRAVVAAGPWIGALLPDLKLPVQVTRQAVLWVRPERPELFEAARFPIFMLESRLGIHYGFPYEERFGLKVARHFHVSEAVDPEDYDRTVSADDEAIVRAALAEFMPAANAPNIVTRTCLYTMTPDGHFILDRHPGAPQITIASVCSGHGFKFAPVMGHILADLATEGRTARDIGRFALARLA